MIKLSAKPDNNANSTLATKSFPVVDLSKIKVSQYS